LDFFEIAQSSGSEQNSVSIALKPLYEGIFFKLWQELTDKKSIRSAACRPRLKD
jgi:hypothetical protein